MAKPTKQYDLSLYLVLDPQLCGGITGMLQTVQIAINNGVTMIQLREGGEWKKKQWVEAAIALQEIIYDTPIPLIINDHVDVALAVEADGVHVGQRDLPVELVRQLVGSEYYVGLSISNHTEIKQAPWSLIDYIGVGPIFPTTTKTDAAPAVGIAGLHQLLTQAKKPVVAIGGIGHHNMSQVMSTGVAGAAVVSAICGQPDVAKACQSLRQIITRSSLNEH